MSFLLCDSSYTSSEKPSFYCACDSRCAVLNPEKRNDPASLTAVSKLTLVNADVLQSTVGDSVLPKVFRTQPTLKTEEICDLVRSQWKLYQAECVPEEFYVEHVEESNKGRMQDSYWRRVEEEFGLGITALDKEERQMKRIDDYWCQIGQLKDEQGRKKCPQLFALVKCVLPLRHGNSAPENGFSINKSMLKVHGHSLGEDTLEALRVVKDAIVNSGSVLNIRITHTLIMSVKNFYQKYQADLGAKRKLKEEAERRKRATEEEAKQLKTKSTEDDEVSKIDEEIKSKRAGIAVADETIFDGNRKFQIALRQKCISRSEIQNAQSQIEMGLQRKQTLEREILELEGKQHQSQKRRKCSE